MRGNGIVFEGRHFMRLAPILAVALAAAPLSPLAVADTSQDPAAAASKLAREAVQDEIAGRAADREAKLRSALEQAPDSSMARWLGGYVRNDKSWQRYDDEAHANANRKVLAEYEQARAQSPNTVEGQLRMAGWCATRKLADQERAHLTRVLELAPDHSAARAKLGFVLVDGAWLSRQEIVASGLRAKQASVAFARWEPKLLAIGKGLLSESAAAREAATAQLLAIRDPAAIPAMEAVLSAASDDAAEAVVRTLDKMYGAESSLALARHAVFAPWYPVGELAAEKLKSRPLDHYVPALLSEMYTPIQTKTEIYSTPGGRLMYTHLFYREGESQRDLKVLTTEYTLRGDIRRARVDAAALAENSVRVRETVAENQNEATENFNERVSRVLSTATGVKLETLPDKKLITLPASKLVTLPAQKLVTLPAHWWSWWNDRNEVYNPDIKPLRQEYRYANETVEARPVVLSQFPGRRCECLVAGTPVWTSVGAVAVEKLRIGDLVLAQDPESGELAYKPVLKTTVRPAELLVEFTAGQEKIRCSGGHPFWVSGTGWVKARDFKPDMVLHGVDGPVKVGTVSEAAAEATYNLIVADFHSYFAGASRILSHDNTVRRPTDAVVPGVAEVSVP